MKKILTLSNPFLYFLIPLIFTVSIIPLYSFADTGISGVKSQTDCTGRMSPIYDEVERMYFCSTNVVEYEDYSSDNSKTPTASSFPINNFLKFFHLGPSSRFPSCLITDESISLKLSFLIFFSMSII